MLLSDTVAAGPVIDDLEKTLNTTDGLAIAGFSQYLERHQNQEWYNDQVFYSLVIYSDDPVLPEMVMIITFHEEKLYAVIAEESIASSRIIAREKSGRFNVYYFENGPGLKKRFRESHLKNLNFAE